MPQNVPLDTLNGVSTNLPEIFRPVFEIFDSNPNPFAKNPRKNQITFPQNLLYMLKTVLTTFSALFSSNFEFVHWTPENIHKITIMFELFFRTHRMHLLQLCRKFVAQSPKVFSSSFEMRYFSGFYCQKNFSKCSSGYV